MMNGFEFADLKILAPPVLDLEPFRECPDCTVEQVPTDEGHIWLVGACPEHIKLVREPR